ncbi:MAG: porin, partial [Comamonadaceae bacterium]|nr:porin [Comamonadaceae bacterium]
SGLNTVSRFGVRGSEDLGGGLKASFRLESGINADDGMPNNAAKWWSRWNHVGVSGPWGAVDLGRMWSPTFIVGLTSDPLARNRTSLGWNMFLQQSGATTTAFTPGFIDNSVRYTSPRVGGAWGELMYTFGEASNSSGNGLGMNLQYAGGPLYLGYGYQRINSGSTTAPSPAPKPSVSHFVGATYRVGALTLYGTYNLNASDEPNVPDSTNAMVSLRWGFAERQAVLAQFAQRRVRDSDIKANGLQLGYDYTLSKRTTLYARHARIANAGRSAITLNGVALSAAGADPSFFALGMSHVF